MEYARFRLPYVARFQVSLTGRFWVSANNFRPEMFWTSFECTIIVVQAIRRLLVLILSGATLIEYSILYHKVDNYQICLFPYLTGYDKQHYNIFVPNSDEA